MQKFIPIETPLGILYGRSIFLDVLTENERSDLILKGEFGTHSLEEPHFLPYTLTFHSCISYFACELDTYINLSKDPVKASFVLIENSKWLKKLPIREDCPKSHYKHYRIYTYDVVYDIIATGYELKLE